MKNQISKFKALTVAAIMGASGFAPMIVAHPAHAQSTASARNLIPESEAVSIQAKIRSINKKTRAVTLVGPSGNSVTVVAGPAVRLEMLKDGDRVNAKFYRSVAFALNGPQGGNGVPVSNDTFAQVIAQPVTAPGGIAMRLIKVSGTVVGIDLSSHSLDVVNPSGGRIFTLDVTDPARIALLSSLKVGDTISAVISEVLAVSIEPARKRWF